MKRQLLYPLWVTLLTLAGCQRSPDLQPPQVHYGAQECAWCRMLISDERFAAALVLERDGQVEKPVFDDINCAFGYISEHQLEPPYELYTHDLVSRGWLNARAAAFVHSSVLETPMAAQIAAAPTPAAARELLTRYPGQLLTFDQVAQRFTRSTHPDSH